jgi:hypothetical protein
MSFGWVGWSNPVAVWWIFLISVSSANIALWLRLHRCHRKAMADRRARSFGIELLVLLCAAYVFGCAFRSVLPRADIQRICLFDTWLSSVTVGRSVATVAELCFAVQWAIVLHHLATSTKSITARNISYCVVPLILLAEFFSWYAVISTDYLGNAVENSLWAITFALIGGALFQLLRKYRGVVKLAIGAAILGISSYVAFLITVDVPMYLRRWEADLTTGKKLLGPIAGLHDLNTRWLVTHDIVAWREEMAWMSLYFSVAVWSSLALASIALIQDRLMHYRAPLRARETARPAQLTDGPAVPVFARRAG